MAKSLEEVEKLRIRLVDRYLHSEINGGGYISGIGIIKTKFVDKELIPKWGEYGLKFYIKEAVRPLFEIPEEIEGVRIYKMKTQGLLWPRKSS